MPSSEMVKIAKEKFPEAEVICGDVLECRIEEKFDAIMIYNAFPHFSDPEKLIERLSLLTEKSGRLSIAHGISEEEYVVVRNKFKCLSIVIDIFIFIINE